MTGSYYPALHATHTMTPENASQAALPGSGEVRDYGDRRQHCMGGGGWPVTSERSSAGTSYL
eukprot:COSAG05_NODE_730_length_7672_cov_341.864783_3_plen_62_part_00